MEKKQTLTLPPRSGTITEMSWSSDGNKLAAVTDRGWLYIWYTHTGKLLLHWHLGRTRLLTVAWDRKSRSLAVGAQNGTLYRLSRLSDPMLSQSQFSLPLTQIAWSSSPLGRCLVVSGQTLTILEGCGNQTQIVYPSPILDAAWAANGRTLAVVCESGLVDVWDADQRQSQFSCSDIADPACLCFHPDGRLVIGSRSGSVYVCQPRFGHPNEVLALSRFPVHRLAFGKHYLIASNSQGHLALWAEPGAPVPVLPTVLVPTFVLHPQRNQLATVQPGKVALIAL